MKSLFSNEDAFERFRHHLSKASVLVRIGVYMAAWVRTLLGPRSRNLPFIEKAVRPVEALVAMHNHPIARPMMTQSQELCGFGAVDCRMLDLVVVGSGPGGGVSAYASAETGQKVLIVEKGWNVNPLVEHHSPEQMLLYFRNGGQEVLFGNGLIPFAQGQSWGGGSEINSGLYHRAPGSVIEQWAKVVPALERTVYESIAQAVETNLKVAVQGEETLGPYSNSPIKQIGEQLGWPGGIIPRWRSYGVGGFAHHGMSSTYLAAAEKRGAQKLLGHEVAVLELVGGAVRVTVKGMNCHHSFEAKGVCVSAGSLGTPTILVKSGLIDPRLLTFNFHAMSRVAAKFQRPINDLKDIDPHQVWTEDYSMKIGAGVATPALLKSTLAAKGIFSETQFSQIGVFYISFAADGVGRLVRARENLVPVFLKSPSMVRASSDSTILLQETLTEVGGAILGDRKVALSSVHVFGTLPLGKERLPLSNTGELEGSDGRIFVRDGSILPSAPLVNPQGPIMHLCTALEMQRLRVTSLPVIE